MNNKTLEEQFSDYIFMVYGKRPNELPANQAKDLKFAFFAGCSVINDVYVNATELDEDRAMDVIDNIQNQIKQFVQDSFPNHFKN